MDMTLELSNDFKNVDGEILRSLNVSRNGGGVETASELRLCAWDVLAIGHSDLSEGDAQKGVVQHAKFSERALEEKWRRFRRLLSLVDTSLPGISTVQVLRSIFVNRSERTGKGYQLFAMDRDTAVRVRIVQWILPPISAGIRPARLYLKISFLTSMWRYCRREIGGSLGGCV